jgi:hypothetical protein
LEAQLPTIQAEMAERAAEEPEVGIYETAFVLDSD